MAGFDYYDFRIKVGREKVSAEIDFYNNHPYGKISPTLEYLKYLQGRITNDKFVAGPLTLYDKSGNKCEIKKMNLDDYVNDMNIVMFHKPWTKIRDFHKQMKIKEYVDSLKYRVQGKNSEKVIEENREYIKREVCEGLKTKKFCKNKSEIVYDQEKMVIESISCLVYNKKKNIYEIDWDL